jgi:hypothetical protein
MSKYSRRSHRHRRRHLVHLLYVLRDTQPEDGGIYPEKTCIFTTTTSPPRHYEEYDKTPELYIEYCIPVIHIRLHQPRKRDAYLSTLQERYFQTTHQVISIQSSKNDGLTAFIEYILSTTASLSTPESVLNKINNQISYECKDIIILAMICYMKIDEDDINKKNVFITATEEDAATTATDANEPELPPSVLTPMSVYDDKYKYLYT